MKIHSLVICLTAMMAMGGETAANARPLISTTVDF